MKMTDEARKAAGDRMRVLNAKRRAEKLKVEVIVADYGTMQMPPQGQTIAVNLRAPEYTWLNVYFEDGRAFKIPVSDIVAAAQSNGHIHAIDIIEIAESLEWSQISRKAIPILRERAVDEAEAWRTARKELR